MNEEEVLYAVNRDIEPEEFYALCDENLRLHRKAIQESYDLLKEKEVPDKYIFVIIANRYENPYKEGDIFAFTDQKRLESQLSFVREHVLFCLSPYTCLSLCRH